MGEIATRRLAGKERSDRRLVREWNRYPLKRITEHGGVAIGFGKKHFCSVSFAALPQDFYDITIEPGRTEHGTSQDSFYFSSLPPWWQKADSPATDTAPGNLNPARNPAGPKVEVDANGLNGVKLAPRSKSGSSLFRDLNGGLQFHGGRTMVRFVLACGVCLFAIQDSLAAPPSRALGGRNRRARAERGGRLQRPRI